MRIFSFFIIFTLFTAVSLGQGALQRVQQANTPFEARAVLQMVPETPTAIINSLISKISQWPLSNINMVFDQSIAPVPDSYVSMMAKKFSPFPIMSTPYKKDSNNKIYPTLSKIIKWTDNWEAPTQETLIIWLQNGVKKDISIETFVNDWNTKTKSSTPITADWVKINITVP